MSDTEKLFYQLQEKTGGNRKWSNLNLQEQNTFIQAINYILWVTAQTL